jgi:hypothetical protein
MIVDGHAHACGVYANSNSIKKHLEMKHIDMVVLCGGEPNSDKNYTYPMLSKLFKGENLSYVFNKIIKNIVKIKHTSDYICEQNEIVSRLQQELPDNVINVYWINPLEGDCIEKMDRFYTLNGFKMVKLHQCWTPFEISSKCSIEIIKWAANKNLPIFIHLFSNKEVISFAEVANRFNDVTFIVGHMIGFNTMSGMLQNENVYFDISAPQLYSEEILKSAIDKVGCHRLILGSDSPYGIDNLEKNIKRLKKLLLTENQIKIICGENIMRILQLKKDKSINRNILIL